MTVRQICAQGTPPSASGRRGLEVDQMIALMGMLALMQAGTATASLGDSITSHAC